MRRLPALSGLILIAVLALAPAAEARPDLRCNRTLTDRTVRDDLIVPAGGACRLKGVTVRGDVEVRAGGYLHATRTTVRGDAFARKALTLFLDGGSKVKGGVSARRTGQVFLFASTIGGGIDVRRASGKVNVCGNTIDGDIHIFRRSGPDILVGDPLAIDCPGNVVRRGDIVLEGNSTDVELVVRGNTLKRGNLVLKGNGGPSAKIVEGNTGNARLLCTGNAAPFAASGNKGWERAIGQCA